MTKKKKGRTNPKKPNPPNPTKLVLLLLQEQPPPPTGGFHFSSSLSVFYLLLSRPSSPSRLFPPSFFISAAAPHPVETSFSLSAKETGRSTHFCWLPLHLLYQDRGQHLLPFLHAISPFSFPSPQLLPTPFSSTQAATPLSQVFPSVSPSLQPPPSKPAKPRRIQPPTPAPKKQNRPLPSFDFSHPAAAGTFPSLGRSLLSVKIGGRLLFLSSPDRTRRQPQLPSS